jgi:predicted alpha/beta superfamily hydrolase
VRLVITVGLLLLPLGYGPARSVKGAPQASHPVRADVILPDAHTVLLHRAGAAGAYRIFVALPASYNSSEKRYPVLYTLDANGGFALIAQTYRLLRVDPATPDLVLVGIGYDEAGADRRNRRGRDLTPTRVATDANTGGSQEFLAFVAETLIPFIDSTYRTIPSDRAIHGHSIGGLFALYALFHQPELFRRYLVSSPSLWWDDAVLLKYESQFAQRHSSLAKSVFLSVGSEEPEDMRMYFQPFVDRLRSRGYAGLSVDAVVLPEEDHLSVFGAAFVRGLRAVYGAPVPRF